ncbi:MAG: prepilin-type N-terminal cleavage/methylation domain-containing protein [Lachnospiraceae bacterium]|nr:prepilin-type N-terminal cleavage/methylation domain-containing protein [Lachnospiraceae bacterium]
MSIFAKAKEMKKNKKGFTLVELIVVLVILAILAAILVPALLGYIDRARQKQSTTNASTALTAAQAIASEAYGLNSVVDAATDGTGDAGTEIALANFTLGTNDNIAALTSIDDANATVTYTYLDGEISAFTYADDNYTAVWQPTTGNWDITES